VLIRRALADEGEQIAELWLRCRRSAVPQIPPTVHDDSDVRRWFREVVLPHREVWLACPDDDQELLGVLVLDGEWVEQLYVAPEHVSRGIGSRLLDVAKAARPDGLQLWTFQSNVGAQRFYERHGFVPVARTDGDNEEGAPDIRYTWRG
jgi:GNAT superfamily N-acetyltransferase